MFSKNRISNVSCIGLEGKNVNYEDYTIDIISSADGIEEIDNYKYRGLFLKCLNIELTLKEQRTIESIEIHKIIFDVDGERREVEFDHPIKHEFIGGNVFTEYLQIAVMPNGFSTRFINSGADEHRVAYRFNTTESIVLERIYALDYLTLSNLTYSVNGSDMQELQLPLEVPAERSLSIEVSFESPMDVRYSELMTNIFFDYKTKEGVSYTNELVVVFDPIFPIQDHNIDHINKLVEHLLSK
jgi:hypothetical protein